MRRAAALAELRAHSLGDRPRRAPVVLSTLVPALVVRLLIAPARSDCISAILGALLSGGRQAAEALHSGIRAPAGATLRHAAAAPSQESLGFPGVHRSSLGIPMNPLGVLRNP